MACGSGQLIADLVTGYRPEIRTDGLDVSRYRKASTPRATLVPGEDAA
jgi:D-amino-acid dehydrogenase